jgi:hypothetical protein
MSFVNITANDILESLKNHCPSELEQVEQNFAKMCTIGMVSTIKGKPLDLSLSGVTNSQTSLLSIPTKVRDSGISPT